MSKILNPSVSDHPGGARAGLKPLWPDYFARVGQEDATTWHYRGYWRDTVRIWAAYYGFVLRHPIISFIGLRRFFSSLIYRIFGERSGRLLAPVVAALTPLLMLVSPPLALVAVATAPPLLKFAFKKPVPPLFAPFRFMGWVNYCVMLFTVFIWHGYRQHRCGWSASKVVEHSSKVFWNAFFSEHLPEGLHPTRIVAKVLAGRFEGELPEEDLIVKPTSSGAGERLRSMRWDGEVYRCTDPERLPDERSTYTAEQLREQLGTYIDAVVEKMETSREPLPVSSLRVLTLCLGDEARLICVAFLPAPEGSISTAYFDLDTYLMNYEERRIGEPLRPGSDGRFEGLEIPELDGIIEACLAMHEQLPGHVEISWDILLAERGPVFLEGNVFPPGCDYKLTIFKSKKNFDFMKSLLLEPSGP